MLPLLGTLATGIKGLSLGKAVGGAISSGVGSLASSAFGKITGKIFGVPDPEPPSPTEIGMSKRAEMDAAYPGTTAWERLGVSGLSSGQAGIAAMEKTQDSRNVQNQLNTQTSLELMKLKTQKDIAEKTNVANLLAASVPAGINAQQETLNQYFGKGVQKGFTSQLDLLKQKNEAEIKRMGIENSQTIADTQIKLAQAIQEQNKAEISKLKQQYKELIVEAELTKEQATTVTQLFTNSLKSITKAASEVYITGRDMVDRYYNRGKKPNWAK